MMMFESYSDQAGQVPDNDARMLLHRLDPAIEQCQAAIVSGRGATT